MPTTYVRLSQEELRSRRVQRFWARVERTETCWLWTGRLCSEGYGDLRFEYRRMLAHRLSYELVVGPIPPGLQLDHLCRVRRCVNPAHLEPVTGRVNTLRGMTLPALNARKTQCPRGHAYDEANTYFEPSGGRQCRTCHRERSRRRRSLRAHVEEATS